MLPAGLIETKLGGKTLMELLAPECQIALCGQTVGV